MLLVTAFFVVPDPAAGQVTALAADPAPGDPALAAGEAAAQGPEVRRMTVFARAPERPALRYRLLPDVTDQTPGNAAPTYLVAFLQAAGVPETNRSFTPEQMARLDPKADGPDKIDYYLRTLPFDQVAKHDGEIQDFLNPYTGAFETVDVAARREHCRWELALREQGFRTLLPHLAPARNLTAALAIRARLRAARKDYAGAVRSLQPAFALARDLNDQPFLVQTLVGAAIASRAVGVAEEFGRQPGAPNLYWPLAGLPRPFADVHAALVQERAGVYYTLPALRRVRDGGALSAADWQAVVSGMAEFTGNPFRMGPAGAGDADALLSALVLYPRAKQYLVDKGTPAAEVEAMSVSTALARYVVDGYEDWYDEMVKWTALPYWQGRDGLDRAMLAFERSRGQFQGNPLLAVIPAVGRAYVQGAKVDRTIAAAQTVEAIRAYAAAHDGRPPGRLEEMTETPAPDDPTTGKPFVYKADGERATIESPAPAGMQAKEGLRIEVTVVR